MASVVARIFKEMERMAAGNCPLQPLQRQGSRQERRKVSKLLQPQQKGTPGGAQTIA
jgi:hypothetical protein